MHGRGESKHSTGSKEAAIDAADEISCSTEATVTDISPASSRNDEGAKGERRAHRTLHGSMQAGGRLCKEVLRTAEKKFNVSSIDDKWSEMKESKRQKAKREFEGMDEFVAREYRESPDAYIVDYFSRKAKVENGSLVYGVVAALAINLAWQFISGFVSSAAPAPPPSNLAFALKVFSLAMNFVFLGASVAVVYIFHFFNRKQKKQLLLEEHLLRKHGFIS